MYLTDCKDCGLFAIGIESESFIVKYCDQVKMGNPSNGPAIRVRPIGIFSVSADTDNLQNRNC